MSAYTSIDVTGPTVAPVVTTEPHRIVRKVSRVTMTSVAELLDAARADVESGQVPACQIAVARRNEIVAFDTFGDATDTTRFGIFSATKPIVASAIWLLIADGLIDVTRRVCDYIPELRSTARSGHRPAGVAHTSRGFRTEVKSDNDGADPTRRRGRFAQWKLEWEPGTRFEYHAAVAHWVLADLIERVSGDDFRDFIEQRVCAPNSVSRACSACQSLPNPTSRRSSRSAKNPARSGAVPSMTPLLAPGNPGRRRQRPQPISRFYQALLHNPHELWDPAVSADITQQLFDARSMIR